MTRSLQRFCLLAALAGAACGHQTPGGGLAAELEKAFPAPERNACVAAALNAIRSNDFVGSVMLLENVKRAPGAVTPQQRRAIDQARLMILSDLTARADRGDAPAKADLAALERTRSQ